MTNPSTDLLDRYRAGTCTPDERRQVEIWYNSFDQKTTLSDAHPETSAPVYRALFFQRIQQSISDAETTVTPFKPIKQSWQYAVAASLTAITLLACLWWQQSRMASSKGATVPIARPLPASTVQFTNTQAKILRHELPDGSVVWLSPDAQISYPKRFSEQKRSVSFVGEGFFSVQKDAQRPFVIRSGRMITEVLGTSFNVQAHPANDRYEVAVVTGKVAVSLQSTHRAAARRVLLTPRQQAVVNLVTAAIETHTQPEDAKPALYEPVSIAFDWASLDEVVRRLEATYDIRIRLANPALRYCRLRADFTHQRLPTILELLSKSVDASYTINGNVITLTGAGCPDESDR